MLTFQDIILKLNDFWKEQGCVLHHSYDGEVGAGTFHPATFIRSLGPEPYCAAYTQLSRRPTDGRYGENPNRLQRYFQYQVILKPVPRQFLTLYFKSLAMLGINGHKHDVRLVHDDWQSPTLGAKGLGWEVWLSGMEVSQITYFQQVASIDVPLVTGEITYGLERLALFLQGVDSVYDIRFNDHLTYGDIYLHNEQAHSKYNFELASVKTLMQLFTLYENEAKELLTHRFNDKEQHTHKKDSTTDSITTSALPSYDLVIKCSHLFNLLDARSAISAIERDTYIARIRTLAKQVAENYLSERKAAGFPLTKYIKTFSEKFNATPPQPSKTLSPPAIPPNPRNVDPARKNSLLIEIGVEELPHETLEKTEINFHTLCTQTLVNHALTCSNAKAFSTPRRLAFLCQLEQSNNNPPHEALLKPIERAIQQIFEKLPLKKSNLGETMRWGTSDETQKVFIRPITYILILLDNHPIEFSYAGITNAPITRGHRWLTPGSDKNNTTILNDFAGQSISINNPNHWEDILAGHYVIADRMKRQSMIEAELTRLSERNDWEFVAYHKLLPVVTQLIEYPTIIIGEFAEQFLTLPEEVIVSELVEHQKYFPIRDRKTQKLLPRFIITSNIKENANIVKTGNERVLTARLRDGLFFYENDLKNLAFYRTNKLQTITYYEGIGSYQDKVSLLRQVLKTLIENHLPHGYASIPDSNTISTLCDYAKIDIASQMVAEFPHLQGVIGSYYTDYALRHNNANNLKPDQIDKIVDAIKYQYVAPSRLLSDLPEQDAMLRYFFALADRLTHLIPLFAVGVPVTGSKDPKGIRRAVIEIADLLLGGIWVKNASTGDSECYRPSFSFKKFWTANPYLYEPYLKHHPKKLNANQLFKELLSLLNSRLPNVLNKQYLKSHPPFNAAISNTFSKLLKAVLTDRDWNPLHSFNLLRCIIDFRNKSPVEWLAILTVHKRISHILTREKKTSTIYVSINESYLYEPKERELFQYYQATEKKLQTKKANEITTHSFNDTLKMFSGYEPKISEFFADVMVNVKDQALKKNRLSLLSHIKTQLDYFLDFNQLQEVSLIGVNLQGANLRGALLQDADLSFAQLQGADLSSAQLQGASLWKAQLQRANLSKAQFQGADLIKAQLEGADLEAAQLQGANLHGAWLQGAKLWKAQLQGANLFNAQLQGVNLHDARFQGANLSYAHLQEADLREAQFQGAYLNLTQLQGANLSEAQLQGADLEEAHLQGANLSSAGLQMTNLSSVQFQGADLIKTDFRGAFTEQKDNTDFNIDDTINQLKARSDKETELEIVCFSGGVGKYELDNFKKTTAETLEELNKIKNYDQHKINDFKNRMNKVEKILKNNIDKPIDTSIPSEAITGVYPKAEADKIIAMLEEVKKTTEPNN